MKYSVILPCYQEEKNLDILLPKLKDVMRTVGQSYEILVIDSCEPLDNTANVCKTNDVTYINRQPGNYYGDAVRTGLQHASGERIICMDSDGSHSPEFIIKMHNTIEKNPDIDLVIASRYINGGDTDNSRLLVLMSKLLNKVYAKVFNITFADLSNSFRIYRASLLKDIKLNCNHFDIVEEILIDLLRNKPDLKGVELPYIFKQRLHGKSKRNLLIFLFHYLKLLVKYRFFYKKK